MKNIIQDLKGENTNAFGNLYKEYFPAVNRFIIHNKGNTEDAEDIFQDTMMVLLEKLRQDNFQLTASIKTYIMAISKNLWLKRLKNNRYETEFSETYTNRFYEEISLAIESEKSYMDKLQNLLHKITKHCQGLIHDMFFKEKTVEEIQKNYGYSNKHTLQNQKYKCVEQIKKVKAEENL